jgi:hypothetical protein
MLPTFTRKEPRLLYLPAFSAILLLLIGCGQMKDPVLQPGGLYSVEDGSGGFRAAKLLRYDSAVVHLRLYCNRFTVRPDTLAAGALRLQSLEGEPTGRPHFPAARYLFRAWNPELIGFDSVTAEETKLLEEWERSGSAVVGR